MESCTCRRRGPPLQGDPPGLGIGIGQLNVQFLKTAGIQEGPA